MEFLTNNLNLIVGGGSSAIAIFLLKKIPNRDLYAWVETTAYWAGTALTLGLSKWKWNKKIWNKTIEPYFVDLLNNTIKAGVDGFIDGLKSD